MKNNTRKTLQIYWRHMKKRRALVFVALFSVITASIVNVILPLYFKEFFDVLTSGQSKEEVYNGLILTLTVIAGLELLQWTLWRFASFSSIYFQSKTLADLSNSCFEYLHKHSFSYFNNNFTGSLIKRVNYFVRSCEDIADRITWELIPLVVSISVITTVLFWRNIFLGMAIIVWLLVFLAFNWIFINYK